MTDSTDGPGGCCAEVNKPDKETQAAQSHLYVGYKTIHPDTENKLDRLMVAGEEEGGGWNDVSED